MRTINSKQQKPRKPKRLPLTTMADLEAFEGFFLRVEECGVPVYLERLAVALLPLRPPING